jgi:hypothetical protein
LISIQTALLVGLGFLVASLLVVLLTPAYRARTVRLTTARVRASLPATEQELKADKDRIRAENALRVHRLEQQLEQFKFGSARQLVEVSRRDGIINTLTADVAQLKSDLEAAQNARNVLEHTIADRLPRVEQRLIEAKKLLFQRDREVATIGEEAQRTQRALVESVQINAQQRAEIDRLTMALETRGALNRGGLSDPAFDTEVAMKSEIEALRARTRDQASLIERLQGGAGAAGENALGSGAATPIPEVVRMQRELLLTESIVKQPIDLSGPSLDQQASHEVEIRQRDQRLEDQAREIATLKASLATYAEEAAGVSERGSSIKDSRIAMKSRISGLQVQTEGQAETIRKLRAEISGLNEQLARQAQHFMEEMRRLGAGTLPAAGSARRTAPPTDRKAVSLTQRITDAKPELSLGVNAVSRPVLVKSDTAPPAAPAAAPAETAEPEQSSTVVAVSDTVETDAVAFAKDEQSDVGTSDATQADVAEEAADAAAAAKAEPTPARPAVARPRLIDRLTDYGKA